MAQRNKMKALSRKAILVQVDQLIVAFVLFIGLHWKCNRWSHCQLLMYRWSHDFYSLCNTAGKMTLKHAGTHWCIRGPVEIITCTCKESPLKPQLFSQLELSLSGFRQTNHETQLYEEWDNWDSSTHTKAQQEIILIKPNAQSRRQMCI